MTLVTYQDRLPNLVDRFFNNDFGGWDRNNFSNTTLPAVNIKENTKAFFVEVAAPGFEKSDFKIELNNDVLTISSERKITNELQKEEQFSKQEFNYQSFTRSFTIPEFAEYDKISAKYEQGILAISIPKMEEAKTKPVKQIEIK